MKQPKCIIIEDQPPAQRILQKFIKDLGTLELVETFNEAAPAIAFLQEHDVDLIFLDIHLPKMSGLDFLKSLRHRPSVILTTAFSDYAIESYDLEVLDYLLKPFSFQRFAQAVAKLRSRKNLEERNSATEIFIKSGYEFIKVAISDIRYIKSDADYTEIHTGSKVHISSEPLRFWEEYLDPDRFVRLHKSYIVNSSKIERVLGTRVFLDSKEEIPVGRAFKDAFTSRFLK